MRISSVGWWGRCPQLYFQTYQLAFDMAKQAERCLAFELGEPDGADSYIRFGYWDSLKKGLLAGEQLAHDLQRLELAHLEKNVREYELTKHVSLAALDPLAFITLKETGKCERLTIPESLFDLDTPGHYLRWLKQSASPFRASPGPTRECTASCVCSTTRSGGSHSADDGRRYPRNLSDDPGSSSIGGSRGDRDEHRPERQRPSEPNLRDERYLPFEGAGAISTWSLELPADFRSFDYNTISDVILHLRYTARDGGDALKAKAAKPQKRSSPGACCSKALPFLTTGRWPAS